MVPVYPCTRNATVILTVPMVPMNSYAVSKEEKPIIVYNEIVVLANTRKGRVTCDDKEFPCVDGLQCIPNFSLCDSIEQCSDGSDEMECRKNTHSITYSLTQSLIHSFTPSLSLYSQH